MEENNEALNTSEENTQEESPTTEQTPEEAIEQVEETAVESTSEKAETEEKPKKGYQTRIRELVKERNEAEEKARSFAQRLEELTGTVEPEPQSGQYTPQVKPGEEITPEQYQQDVAKAADGIVQLRIKQSEAINRINNEARDALRAYPQLDPESDSFDRELSDSITEAVEAKVRANPYNASVKQFVDRLMKPYNRAVSKGVSKATENLARQVSESALRPSQVAQSEKKFEDLSISEMEKKLGFM